MNLEKIMKILKTKAASLGFNEDELKVVAELISGRLNSEDASDDDINAQVDAVMPILQVAQKNSSRIVAKSKPATPKAEPTKPGSEIPQDDEMPSWFKKYTEQNEARLAKIEGERIMGSRKSQLEALVKDSGVFGQKLLKTFERMSFEKDEDFAAFIEETKNDLNDYQKELLANGVSTIKPVGGGVIPQNDKPSDLEIDAIVEQS